jgi:hypothetical protein
MMRRSRVGCLGLVFGTILLGLASRQFRSELHWFVAEYAGDTLWAGPVYLFEAVVP